ncbi:hypothetical protein V6N12_034811 [Hibiscus sabdariffa]|uniref:Uncharacterized protein n=1 Tax=Hibiscus sabdariffa TaxID=183260 RepID=A0ABR2B9J5_9ROSI
MKDTGSASAGSAKNLLDSFPKSNLPGNSTTRHPFGSNSEILPLHHAAPVFCGHSNLGESTVALNLTKLTHIIRFSLKLSVQLKQQKKKLFLNQSIDTAVVLIQANTNTGKTTARQSGRYKTGNAWKPLNNHKQYSNLS